MSEEQLSNLARTLVLAGGFILMIGGLIDFAGGNVSVYISHLSRDWDRRRRES